MMRILIVLLLTLPLFGCPKEEIIVTKYVDRPIYTPETLLTKCKITKPPAKEEFMKLNLLGRQTALAKYITELLKDLKACNIKIDSIREWNQKQRKIYSNKTKEAK